MIISGAIRGTSSDTVLGELGWCSISKRREIHKHVLIYKIFHHEVSCFINPFTHPLFVTGICFLPKKEIFQKAKNKQKNRTAISKNRPAPNALINMVRDKVMLRMLGCGWAIVSLIHICLEIMLSTAQNALPATYTKMRIITCLYVLGTWCNGTNDYRCLLNYLFYYRLLVIRF